MFVFNFGVGSLDFDLISLTIPFSKHHFFQTDNQNQCFLQCFCCLSCFSAAVAKENLLKTPAIVSPTNFHILLRHPRLAFDWLSVSSLIIDQSECLICYFLCAELTLFCTELTLFCNESKSTTSTHTPKKDQQSLLPRPPVLRPSKILEHPF